VIFSADWQGGGPDAPFALAKNFPRRKINALLTADAIAELSGKGDFRRIDGTAAFL
jgi:hypothetical protein